MLQLTPYRPLDQLLGGYGDFEFFVRRGAAYVEADERGTGGSGGCPDFRNVADPRSDLCHDDYRGGCYSPSGIAPATTVGRATNTVHVGPEGTALRLHWADPGATQKPPW